MLRLYSILLAGLFILNTIAGISILCIHHFRISSYIESLVFSECDIRQGEIELNFTSTASAQIIWFERGHEFSYHGHMYDVIRIEQKNNGTITYHCIDDTKECEINRNLADNFNASTPGEQHHRTLLLHIFKSLSNFSIDPPGGEFAYESESLKCNFSYHDKAHPGFVFVFSEPPDFI